MWLSHTDGAVLSPSDFGKFLERIMTRRQNRSESVADAPSKLCLITFDKLRSSRIRDSIEYLDRRAQTGC